jgi:hypothetical protein
MKTYGGVVVTIHVYLTSALVVVALPAVKEPQVPNGQDSEWA